MADTHDIRFTVARFGGRHCVCVAAVDGIAVPPLAAWQAPTLVMAQRVCEALNDWGLATAITLGITQAIMRARSIEARLDGFMGEGW